MAEQVPFGTDDFATNPDRRTPCVLLLDTSTSMQGEPIESLNAGLAQYQQEITADTLAIKRVEIAIVTFGPVKVVRDFHLARDFRPPALEADGDTPLGAAVTKGIELVNARKQVYRQNAVDYYRPWIFLFTDGAPTDDWEPAADLVRAGQQAGAFSFFGVAVDGWPRRSRRPSWAGSPVLQHRRLAWLGRRGESLPVLELRVVRVAHDGSRHRP